MTRWRRGGASYGASVEGASPGQRPDEGSSERSVRRNAISHAPRSPESAEEPNERTSSVGSVGIYSFLQLLFRPFRPLGAGARGSTHHGRSVDGGRRTGKSAR